MKPLGTPLPNSPHAVSASMPDWQDVVDYEEGKERVTSVLRSGYPRFVYHPYTAALCREFARDGEQCLVLPSHKIAAQCAAFMEKNTGLKSRLQPVEQSSCVAVIFPETAKACAKAYWQHAGLIISSRQADALLHHRATPDASKEKQLLKERIASLNYDDANNVFLYPSGMGAIFSAHQLVTHAFPNRNTLQLGFPYVDTLKIQQKFGSGSVFINYNNATDIKEVEAVLSNETIAGVFCEVPSNPLLNVIDLPALSSLLRTAGVPLIIDDTVGTPINLDLHPYADIIVTSLTKFFSGVGDVLGGSLLLSSNSPFYDRLKPLLTEQSEDILYAEDAIILEKNSRDFTARMHRINATTELLCDFLRAHPRIASTYYPKYTQPDIYKILLKKGGGYGGLFSLCLKDPSLAPAFYNALDIEKGPSLGTNFTLACPYTLLAHYTELEFAKSSGVAADLIRISVGLEEADDLIARFTRALDL